MDGGLLRPIWSPLGTFAYDLETMITFRKGGFDTSGYQPMSDQFTLASLSVPFLLHTCTGLGQFLAHCRWMRTSALNTLCEHSDTALLKQLLGSKRRSLLQPDEIEDPFDFAPDRLTPGLRLSMRTAWLSTLVGEQALFDLPSGIDLVPEDLFARYCLHGFLDLEGDRRHRLGLQPRVATPINDVFRDGVAHVHRELGTPEISAREMFRFYVGLYELVRIAWAQQGGLREACASFVSDPAFEVARLMFKRFGLEPTAYNLVIIAPELMLAVEVAFASSFPGQREYAVVQPTFGELSPPLRLNEILRGIRETEDLISIDRVSPEALRAKHDHHRATIGVPSKSLFPEIYESIEGGWIGAFYSAATDRLRDGPNWRFWYCGLQRAACVQVFGVAQSLTEYLLVHLKTAAFQERGNPTFARAPFILDENSIVFAGSYLMDNPDKIERTSYLFRSFVRNAVESSWQADLMLRNGAVQCFPFAVSHTALYDRWLREPAGEISRSIARQLRVPIPVLEPSP